MVIKVLIRDYESIKKFKYFNLVYLVITVITQHNILFIIILLSKCKRENICELRNKYNIFF